MADLSLVERLAGASGHLAVFTVARADGSVHASLVSGGVMADPVDGAPGVAAVAGGRAKLRLLRDNPQATMVFTRDGEWVAVSGGVRLIGPDDGTELGLDVPETIRAVFRAAGGDHEDWDEFDRVMAEDRRCAVFVRADAITGNARGG
jgi:PPOX class probable F420-dependent enzyme